MCVESNSLGDDNMEPYDKIGLELPPNIRELIARSHEFIVLDSKKGIPRADCVSLDDEEEAKQILQCWYAFHSQIEYPDFETFYDKELFCQKLDKIELNRERFIHFISDQSFLFLEYADHYHDMKYPLLIDVVKNYKLNGG